MNSNSTSVTAADRIQRILGRWLPHVLIIGVHLILFGSMATGHRAPGFRDSAFLYYPLFKWIDRQTENEGLPRWNPYEDYGVPVIENTTTSVFYPGKAIFLLRALPYPSRFGIYLLFHSLLAAYGAFWCASVLRANRYGATLAAIAYSMSGAVLFQACNIVFLIGAAWLPWSLGCWWLLFAEKNKSVLPWTALPLAMMVLGGDPQMAYHSALIGFFLLLLVSLKRWNQRDATPRFKKLATYGFQYVAVGLLAVGLCSIQMLPSASFSKYSARARQPGEPARSLYEIFETPDQHFEPTNRQPVESTGTHFLAPPPPETHHSDIYDFSQPPWSMTQLFWPNNTGRWMPKLKRWTLFLPDVPKIWTPSLYLGIIPFLLAICGFRLWGKNITNVWLTWMTIWFTLGSMGVYGLVWLLQFCLGPQALEQTHGAVGGVYWLMVVGLPKYVVFRYPAKLFVVATLGLSLLASRQFNPRFFKSNYLVQWSAVIVALLSAFAMYYVLAPSTGFYDGVLSKMGTHLTLGQFDRDGCISDIITGLISTTMILLFLIGGVWLVRTCRVSPRQLIVSLMLVTAVELILANGWLVLTVDSDRFEQPSPFVQKYEQAVARSHTDQAPFSRIKRMNRDEGIPKKWSQPETDSADRLGEIIQWQRNSLFPKFHLDHDIPIIGSFSSVEFMNFENIKHRQSPTIASHIVATDDNLQNNWKFTTSSNKVTGWVKTQPENIPYRFIKFSNHQMVIEFNHQPAEVFISTTWSPGWRVHWLQNSSKKNWQTTVSPDKTMMLKLVNQVEMENNLPVRLVLEYRPQYLTLGIWLTAFSSIVFLLLVVLPLGKRWRMGAASA